MKPDGVGGSGTKDVCPELLALLLRPGIGALVDRDDELRDVSQDLEELGFRGFHRKISKEIAAHASGQELDAPPPGLQRSDIQ